MDAAGNVYAVWTDDRDQQLYLAVSRDKGRTWSERKNVIAPTTNYADVFSNVAALEPGHIAIAYLGSPSTAPIQFGIFPVPSDRSGYIAESFNALDVDPTFDSVPMRPAEHPMLQGSQSRTEGQAYVVFDRGGRPWSVFVENTVDFLSGGTIVVGAVQRD